MTGWRKRTIMEMAQEAGISIRSNWAEQELEAFAKLVREDEREACAKLCAEDNVQAMDFTGGTFVGGYFSRKIIDRGEA